MTGNSPTIKNKISSLVQGQMPEFVKSDHPLFSTFLKHYYEFLESAELTLGGSNDYVVLETNSVNYVLDQGDERVVLETSTGKFQVGETVVGQKTGFSAKILVDDYDNSNRLFVTSQQKFETGETIVGQTSGASAVMVSYRANPVQNIQQLLAYADVDNTVYSFLDKFKDSLLESLPESIADEVSTRNLIKHIKDLYEAKGTEDGHRLFFRILFDEESTFIYPRDNMLRVSDGQWSDDFLMRVIENGTSNFNELIGETITGKNSGATAIISSLVKFKAGSILVTQINLDKTTIEGEFEIGETITGISNVLDLEISATVSSIIGEVVISEQGQYYRVGEEVQFENLGTIGVRGQVERVGAGCVCEIYIADGGTGYSLDDEIVYDNSNTNGNFASARIVVVGGSFLLENSTNPDSLVLEGDAEEIITQHTDDIVLEDNTITNFYIAMEDDSGVLKNEDDDYQLHEEEVARLDEVSYQGEGLLLEDGYKITREESEEFSIGLEQTIDNLDKLILESGSDIVVEEGTFANAFDSEGHVDESAGYSSEKGEIRKIQVTDRGDGYTSLPRVSIGTDENPTSGSGAELIPLSYSGVGKVLKVKITNYGLNYTGDPKVTFNKALIVSGATGDFTIGDTLTNFDAQVVDWRPDSNILELKTEVPHFQRGDILNSISGVSATVVDCWHAEGTASREAIIRTDGVYITDKGKVSQDTMKIQDSFYYQDYSYVVRIGESINQWRESVRRSVHPAGWNVFGEVSFATSVAATIRVPAAGDVVDYVGDETFTPELASTFTNLFTTIFGRRLGTVTDSTPRVNAGAGVAEPSELASGERDVTLTSAVQVKMNLNRGNTSFKLGPTLENIVRYGFNVDPVNTSNPTPHGLDKNTRVVTSGDNFSRDQYSLAQIGHIAIRDLCLADGSIPDAAFTTKINIMPPSEIYISRGALRNGFDDDFISFDDGVTTFDESGTPRDTEGRYATSFDETGPTEFDSDTVTFDAASGNEQDYEVKTFDESDDTFDVSTNSFDASNTIGTISLFSNNNSTFDKSTETYDTQ